MMRILLCAAFWLALLTSAHAGLRLSSPVFADGQFLTTREQFSGFGCSGDNISPALNWSGVPEGAKSLALTMYDPDAPTGSGWWHWVVYNLPPALTSLPSGAGTPDGSLLPTGTVQGMTDFGSAGYGGMCPPVGDKPHHYVFTLYALKEPLQLDAAATAAMVGYNLNANMIEKATLTGLFARPAQP